MILNKDHPKGELWTITNKGEVNSKVKHLGEQQRTPCVCEESQIELINGASTKMVVASLNVDWVR